MAKYGLKTLVTEHVEGWPPPIAETDLGLDGWLLSLRSEDTPLMSLMLAAEKVEGDSPEAHYPTFTGEPPSKIVYTSAAVAAGAAPQFKLPLSEDDKYDVMPGDSLLVCGMDGYEPDGQSQTPGKPLLLVATGRDSYTQFPVVRAVNGPKGIPTAPVCKTPAIPAGSQVLVLARAVGESQEVAGFPPFGTYTDKSACLQKRGITGFIEGRFDSLDKVPITQRLVVENAVLDFKRAGNRTLWAGREGLLWVPVATGTEPNDGYTYTAEGARWQMSATFEHSGGWDADDFLSLAKAYFAIDGAPARATLLAGGGLVERIQSISFASVPGVQVRAARNSLGWPVTRIHTGFGDIDVKRDPALDELGWSNSGGLIADGRIVHYERASFCECVPSEEEDLTRVTLMVQDALVLLGGCHVWIDGE